MAATNPVSEPELEAAFREGAKYGVELLDLDYREQIIQYIKRETWGILDAGELMGAYGETLVAVFLKASKEGFDPCRPLRMVNAIARNKGIDVLRARRRCRMRTNQEAILDGIAASLKDTEGGCRWRLLSPTERREFQEAVLDAVQALPERQKIVARCYVDCFEEIIAEGSYRPLAVAVGTVTGTQETVVNVKSAWHVAKKKIATELNRRGFDFIIVE